MMFLPCSCLEFQGAGQAGGSWNEASALGLLVHPLLPGAKFSDGEGAMNASVLRKFEIAHS